MNASSFAFCFSSLKPKMNERTRTDFIYFIFFKILRFYFGIFRFLGVFLHCDISFWHSEIYEILFRLFKIVFWHILVLENLLVFVQGLA